METRNKHDQFANVHFICSIAALKAHTVTIVFSIKTFGNHSKVTQDLRLLPNKYIFQGAQKGKSQDVRSPTGNVLGVAAKTLGAQIIFLGAPGCWAPVRQQP